MGSASLSRALVGSLYIKINIPTYSRRLPFTENELRIGWGDEPPTHGECAEMMAAVEDILALEEAKWSAVAATRAAESGVGSRGNGTILNHPPPPPSPAPSSTDLTPLPLPPCSSSCAHPS